MIDFIFKQVVNVYQHAEVFTIVLVPPVLFFGYLECYLFFSKHYGTKSTIDVRSDRKEGGEQK